MRIKLLSSALVAGAVILSPAAAWADHCANLSRGAGNATAGETQRGRWFFIEPQPGFQIWVFDTPDNFHNGVSDGLLDGSGACNASRLLGQTKQLSTDTVHGIWSEDCFNEAASGLG
jgi:hypothetical protein